MLFQEAPPDTSGYMILGYMVALIVIGLYIFSLYIRNRNLKQDLTLLEEIDKQSVPAQKASVSKPQRSPVKPSRKKSAKS